MDFHALSTILTFGTCDSQQCVTLSIISDKLSEFPREEFFNVTLERTSDVNSRIMLDPVDAVVVIDDDDGA